MLEFSKKKISDIKADMAVLFACEDMAPYEQDDAGKIVKRSLEYTEFAGKAEKEIMFYDLSGMTSERVLVCGLGRAEDVDAEVLRAAAGRAVKKAISMKLSSIAICVPGIDFENSKESASRPVMEGACLANQCINDFREKKEDKALAKIIICTESDAGADEGLAKLVSTICNGTMLARTWVSMPSNEKRPDRFARMIKKAASSDAIKVRVLDEKELKEEGMNAILAVGAGSSRKPRMVILEYRPDGRKQHVALVGKGVTFDSGGINLKSASGIANMKMDMSGAAAAAASVITAARIGIPCWITAVIPIVENMPSGNATRPGDIIKTYSGKTVEIDNTDAEGRLILADALAYAEKNYEPDIIFDIATLTGACMVALGEKIAGLFCHDDDLAGRMLDSANRTHERCWRMPLPMDYKKLLKSDFADIKNISSSSYGGAITGALFLNEFVQTDKWCHIDIAGPAYSKKGGDYTIPGGTGFGVRLLVDFLEGI